MGQGGYITLMNATPYEWELTHKDSNRMNKWEFPYLIERGSSHRLYVEWEYFPSSSMFGDADYTLKGTDLTFQVQARYINAFHLRVDLMNIPKGTTPQSIPPQSTIVDLGWKHDGNVNFTLVGAENSISDAVEVESLPISRFMTEDEQTKLISYIEKNGEDKQHIQHLANRLFNSENILVPSVQQSSNTNLEYTSEETWLCRWMCDYKESLKNLTIEEIALPGTHDSGTYDMKSIVSIPWTRTQDINLEQQLQVGTRALDLRIGIQPSKRGDEKFILVHDTWRTNVTLDDALEQIISFSNEEKDEIIVLDFHRFVELEEASEADYIELMALVSDKLTGRLISPSQSNTKLDDIWKQKERIIVAWNRTAKANDFWGGVHQDWFDKTSKSELYTAIEKDLEKTHSGLWSICAILTPTAIHPVQDLSPDLSFWFSPSGEWSKKVNIVSCDFINRTELVQSLVIANVMKNYSK